MSRFIFLGLNSDNVSRQCKKMDVIAGDISVTCGQFSLIMFLRRLHNVSDRKRKASCLCRLTDEIKMDLLSLNTLWFDQHLRYCVSD